MYAKEAATLGATAAFFALLLISSSAFAATTTDTVTVNVNVSATASISVQPSSVSWTQLSPGSNGAAQQIVVKNIGSVNVSNIYISASTTTEETTNPLGSGDASKYAAAGLIMVQNDSSTQYYHAGRLEWNITTPLAGEVLDLAVGTTNWGRGWYRNSTGNNYLWKVENGTDGVCNNTGTVIKIKTDPENTTTLNSDLSVGTVSATFETAGTDWGVASFASGPLAGYCVAAYKNCDRIYIYKYDMEFANSAACSNKAYARTANLVPGEEFSMNLVAAVPEGFPAGDAAAGTITITANY